MPTLLPSPTRRSTPSSVRRINPPLAGALATLGTWRYRAPRPQRWALFAGAVISGLLHWLVITDDPKHKPPPIVRVAEIPVIQMEMPPMEEEEIEQVVDLEDNADETPPMNVPMLQDAPRLVTIDSFVQPLQVTPDYSASLNNAKLSSIPVNIARGAGDRGLKGGKVFDLSQLDRAPVPITQVPPEFPHELKRDVAEGRAVVEFIVTSSGDVINATLIDASHPGFGTAAVAGVLKWKFRPGMKGGRKVNVRVRIPLLFTIAEAEN